MMRSLHTSTPTYPPTATHTHFHARKKINQPHPTPHLTIYPLLVTS